MPITIDKRTDMNDRLKGIALGDLAQDKLTGWKGAVVGICSYLTGCDQACILPLNQDTEKYTDGRWFDLERVELLAKAAVVATPHMSGADFPPPVRSTPRR